MIRASPHSSRARTDHEYELRSYYKNLLRPPILARRVRANKDYPKEFVRMLNVAPMVPQRFLHPHDTQKRKRLTHSLRRVLYERQFHRVLPVNSNAWRLLLQRQTAHPLGFELPRESKRHAKPHRPRWGTLSQNGYGDSAGRAKPASCCSFLWAWSFGRLRVPVWFQGDSAAG